MSIEERHREMVERLAKPGRNIIEELTPMNAHLLHMAIGISGEAGELLDQIKKVVIYGKKIDMLNVIEELGDIEFYLRGLRDALHVHREETLLVNMSKLGERYSSGGYTNQHAIERADKT